MSTNAPRDPALSDGTISEAYRDASAHLEPNARLDDAIRARARRAVASRPQPVRPSWTKRAAIPFALAASLVLAVGIGYRMVEFDDLTVQHTRERLPSADQTPVAAAPAAPAPAQSPTPSLNDTAPPPARPAKLRRADEERAQDARRAEPAPPTVVGSVDKLEKKAVERAPPPPPPAVVATPPPATASPRAVQPSVVAEAPAVPDPPQELARADRGALDQAPAGPRARAAPEPSLGATGGAVRSDSAVRMAPDNRQAAATTPKPSMSPEDSITRVRQLMRENRLDEARKLLAELRERHPQFTIPEDLRGFASPP